MSKTVRNGRRLIPRVLLLIWAMVACMQGAALWADNAIPRPAGGPVLGIETLVESGQSTVSWHGPYGRQGSMAAEADGRIELWRHPLFSGWPSELTSGRYVVDHSLSAAEAVSAALRSLPWLHGGLFVVVLVSIAVAGGWLEAAVLAGGLGLVRALSPAWILDSDPARYHASALAVLEGGLPDVLWPPGWPLALSAAYGVFGSDPMVGRLLGVGLSVAFVALVGRLARPGARACTSALAAGTALLVQFGPSLYAEPLFLLLSVGALLAMTTGSAVWAGVWVGLAALTRAHLLGVGILLFVVMNRWAVKPLLQFVGALGGTLLLWVAAQLALGVPEPVLISEGLGLNLWIGHGPGADGWWNPAAPMPSGGYLKGAVAAIAAEPGAALQRVLGNGLHLWEASQSDRTMATRPFTLPLVPFSVLVSLAAVGLAVRLRGEHRYARETVLLVGWLALTTAVTALFFVTVRYKLALLPALLPLAGEGAVAVVKMVRFVRYKSTA